MNRAAGRTLLIALLLLAAGLRWWQPGLVEFKYDEAHTVGLARDVASGGPFPLTSGGTSVGIERPAGDVYLLALPLLLGRVEAAVWWLGALGVVAVALTYALGRRVGGQVTGLLAGLYMAVNPWLVLYDRKLWSHIQVVFSVALLLLAWEIVVRARKGAALWFVVIAALQCLTHVLSLLQVLSWLSALLTAPRSWLNRRWLAGLGIAALLLAPYVVGLATNPGPASQAAGSAAVVERVAALAFAPARNLAQALTLFGGSGLHALAGAPPAGIHLPATWLGWLVVALILAGLVLSLRDLRSPGSSGLTARLLLAWAALPLLALVLAPTVYQQYWTVLLPLPALYFAIGCRAAFAALLRRAASPLRYGLAGAALVLLLAGWVGSYAGLLSAIEAGQGGATFGVPLLRWEQAVQAAVDQAHAAGAAGIRVAVQGVDARYEDEPAVIAALLHGRDDVRLVAPGWPYFALIDPRYESDGNVVATEAKRRDGIVPRGPAPGYSVLDDGRPTVFLWAIDNPAIEQALARAGRQAWEGGLAEGRSPARIYALPSRADVAVQAAAAAFALAGGGGPGTGTVAVEEPASAVRPALPGEAMTVLPPAANDRAAADQAVAGLAADGVRRVVLVEQPSGWWDGDSAARKSLEATYRSVGSWPEQLWTLHVYALPPSGLDAAGIQFGGGPRLDAYTVDGKQAPPGGVVVLHTAWSAAEPLTPDLKVSFQLLGADGAAHAQVDRDLRGDEIAAGVQSYGLRLPGDIPTGPYRLVAVVYDGKTGRRLPAPTSDAAELATVTVFEPLAP